MSSYSMFLGCCSPLLKHCVLNSDQGSQSQLHLKKEIEISKVLKAIFRATKQCLLFLKLFFANRFFSHQFCSLYFKYWIMRLLAHALVESFCQRTTLQTLPTLITKSIDNDVIKVASGTARGLFSNLQLFLSIVHFMEVELLA